jgi:hypothetical protein
MIWDEEGLLPQASLPFWAYTDLWAVVLEAMTLKLGKAIRGAGLPSLPLYIKWNIDLISFCLVYIFTHATYFSGQRTFATTHLQHLMKRGNNHGSIKNSTISWEKLGRWKERKLNWLNKWGTYIPMREPTKPSSSNWSLTMSVSQGFSSHCLLTYIYHNNNK